MQLAAQPREPIAQGGERAGGTEWTWTRFSHSQVLAAMGVKKGAEAQRMCRECSVGGQEGTERLTKTLGWQKKKQVAGITTRKGPDCRRHHSSKESHGREVLEKEVCQRTITEAT